MFYQLLGWLVLASRVCRCWNQSPELREHCDFQWRLGSPPQGSAQRLQRRQRCHGFIEDCRHDQWDHWSAGRGIESGRQGGCSGDADDEETKVSQAGKKTWVGRALPNRQGLCWTFCHLHPAEQSLVKTQQLLEGTVVPKMPVESRGKYLLIWYDSKTAGESVFNGAMFLGSRSRIADILFILYSIQSWFTLVGYKCYNPSETHINMWRFPYMGVPQ